MVRKDNVKTYTSGKVQAYKMRFFVTVSSAISAGNSSINGRKEPENTSVIPTFTKDDVR